MYVDPDDSLNGSASCLSVVVQFRSAQVPEEACKLFGNSHWALFLQAQGRLGTPRSVPFESPHAHEWLSQDCHEFQSSSPGQGVGKQELCGESDREASKGNHEIEKGGIKHRIPRPLPRNIIWALDLAVVPKRKEPILAILDHGTRACLALKTLPDKSALAVLVILIPLMRRLGKPRYLRTDNDGTFRSLFFRAVLKLVGVKHRPIAPFCPWQNGRVERFILTMKERLLPWLREVGLSENHFQGDLDLLRFWYNHARPHQHLSGRVPKELWHGGEVSSAKLRFFSEWGGLLAGYYRPPP